MHVYVCVRDRGAVWADLCYTHNLHNKLYVNMRFDLLSNMPVSAVFSKWKNGTKWLSFHFFIWTDEGLWVTAVGRGSGGVDVLTSPNSNKLWGRASRLEADVLRLYTKRNIKYKRRQPCKCPRIIPVHDQHVPACASLRIYAGIQWGYGWP